MSLVRDIDALAAKLQKEGADSFVKSWNELMGVIASKSALEKTNCASPGGTMLTPGQGDR